MSWTQIGYTVLGSAASTVSIAVPTPYDFYRVSAYLAQGANSKFVYVRFNGDSSTVYADQTLLGAASSLVAERHTSAAQIEVTNSSITMFEDSAFSVIVAKPSSASVAQLVGQAVLNSSPSAMLNGGEWNNTSDEVTSMAIVASSGTFAAGTSFLLEGLSA